MLLATQKVTLFLAVTAGAAFQISNAYALQADQPFVEFEKEHAGARTTDGEGQRGECGGAGNS